MSRVNSTKMSTEVRPKGFWMRSSTRAHFLNLQGFPSKLRRRARRAAAALEHIVLYGLKVVVLVVVEVVFVGGLGHFVGVCRNWMGVFGG